MKAIRIHQVGGPETMQLEEIPQPEPARGETRVRLEAIGVNYIDTYHRTGLYPLDLPFTPGIEGAGVVEEVGPSVEDVRVGDRVAFANSLGAYSEEKVVAAKNLAKLPEGMESRTAAAAMLQGITAHYLTRSTFPLGPGNKVLVHAAAGGVGLLLVQLAKRFGATVFGTVSNTEKAEAARAAGADHVILYTQTDFATEVEKLTDGKGVDVVYDSVGKETYKRSMACLVTRGLLVLYGNASGPVPPIDPLTLGKAGSIFLTRPTVAHYTRDRREFLGRVEEIFSWIQSGELRLTIDRALPLSGAAEAHRLLEGRKTKGKLLLVP
ncbi:MAG: quinone oxidoreductase [Vicinamibacteria bacterium]